MKTSELIEKIGKEMGLPSRIRGVDIVVDNEHGDDWFIIDYYFDENCVGLSTEEDMYISKSYIELLELVVAYIKSPKDERKVI